MRDYRIFYNDNIGDNEGEGCLVLANTELPMELGNPEQDVLTGDQQARIKRKYIFGRFYAMFTQDEIIETYDAAKEVTGGYKVIYKLADPAKLFVPNPRAPGGKDQYTGWTLPGRMFPQP